MRESVLRAIEKAKATGRFQAYFTPCPADQYDAVRNAFMARGYRFTLTGYIGGVWQLTENIN